MNLKAFTILAYHGEKLGVDLWNYKPNGVGGIKDAYNFLYPYANGTKKWELKQLGSVEKETERLKNLFVFAGSIFNNEEYCQLHAKNKNDDLDVLLFSCGNQN